MREDTGEHPTLAVENEGTRCIVFRPDWWEELATDVESTFLQNYFKMMAAYAETREFEYLIYAINRRKETIRTRVVRLEPGVFTDLIVGRHNHCRLSLPDDESVSLRHVLVRLYLRPEDLTPVFRVLDLATPGGFETVDRKTVRGLRCEGHGVFCVGDWLVVLLYNDDSALPDYPDVFWLLIKGRPVEQVNELPKELASDATSAGGGESVKEVVAAVRLRARETGLDTRIPLTRDRLRQGVLLGRYERCLHEGQRVDWPDTISRVHLILIEDEGRVFAIDAASVNGCAVADVDFVSRELTGPVRIDLLNATVDWEPVVETPSEVVSIDPA